MSENFLVKIARRYRMIRRRHQIEATRKANLEQLISDASESQLKCPICGGACVDLPFIFNEDKFCKAFCETCEHLFTNWHQTEVSTNSLLFRYTHENEGLATQTQLLEEAASMSCGGRVLDFGVGGNIASIDRAGKGFAHTEYWGCDLYEFSHPRYFQTYSNEHTGQFDAISSYAVVEHLTDPVQGWCGAI